MDYYSALRIGILTLTTIWMNPLCSMTKPDTKDKYCVISQIGGMLRSEIHSDRKQNSSYQELGSRGDGELLLNGNRILIGGHEKVLEMDGEVGCKLM